MILLSEKNIDVVVSELKCGNIVVLPTDTIYGIACDALNEEAIEKVFKIKGRNYNKPLNLHLNKKSDINKYAYISNNMESKIIDKLMPGALTLVMKKKNTVSNILTSNLNTVGIRIPDNDLISDIIDKLGSPLVLTSANISNEKPLKNIKEISKIKDIKYVVDMGPLNNGIESTVIKVENNKVIILREGKISKEEIENILNER